MIEETYNQMEKEVIIKINKLKEYEKNIKDINKEELKKNLNDNLENFNKIIKGNNLNSEIINKVLDKAYINGENIEFRLKMNIDEIIK